MQLAVSTTRFEAFVQLITLVLIFALVLGLTYFVTRFVGNYQKNKLTGTNISVIETIRISSSKYIQLIQIGSRYFAIAVCKDTVTLIGEIEQDDLILTDNTTQVQSESFKTILDKFKKDKPED
ncbi:MAG: flagellar biosynthetic protein FliO [Lachnospira sp.]|nr:flagellar biosynthetic protein FliO [Clostridia bacterium]